MTGRQGEKTIAKKRAQEMEMVSCMIKIYCRGNHRRRAGRENGFCPECRELLEYALSRTQKCPFMENKTFCSACKVHCYSPEMRGRIQAVMRYAGPRMLLVHPVMALKHVKVTLSKKRQKNAGKGYEEA